MPAKSKSQQRLFGMVHAYNNGKLHCSRAMKKRIADIADHISDTDAKHFAKTPHKGLPDKVEKAAQMVFSPEEAQRIYSQLAVYMPNQQQDTRSEKRRSILRSALSGTLIGASLGGIGAGIAGGVMANKALKGTNTPPEKAIGRVFEAGLRSGLWGAQRGAAGGAALGTGIGILGKLRS